VNEKNSSLRSILHDALAAHASLSPRPVNPGVAAVITVEEDLSYFEATLDAVLNQTVLPALVIIADCAPVQGEAANERVALQVPSPRRAESLSASQNVEIQIVAAAHAVSFGDAVNKAVTAGSLRSTTAYLWLLHDDSRPQSSDALEMLLEADRNAPGAKLIGGKQVDWDDASLQNVGYFITKNHRRASLVVDGEEDQDQYDDRQDVYGVSLAGALVSLPTWMNLSGTDSWYTTFGESIDFSRRVYLSGGRVIVAPKVAIAHCRARFAGVRTREGRRIDDEQPRSSYNACVNARDRFASSEISVWAKPFLWVWSVIAALGVFVADLFAKKPYEAVCELVAPWRAFVRTPQSLAARSRLRGLPRSTSGFKSLEVSSAQLREWKQREKVFAAQLNGIVLGPLAVAHLKSLSRHRAVWISLLALIGIGASVAMYWPTLGGIFSGASLNSSILAPTGTNFSKLVETSTTMWSFSYGLGSVAAPLPFSLVLVVLAALSGGHLALSIGLFVLLAPALLMLSMWGAVGVVTRSNPLRFAAALVWGILPGVVGIYQTANLVQLVVAVFLPLSFFLVFRAVGMYALDAPRVAHSSIQSAALAGLSMMFVTLSEPQLVIPFFLVFAVFLVVVRAHRAMLLLMPLPSIVMLMPTFFSMLVHLREGLWRQLFVDAMVPDSSLSGVPGSESLFASLSSTVRHSIAGISGTWLVAVAWVGLVAVGVLLVAALAALFIPSGLRLSRMAWVIAAAGVVLGMIAPRVAIGMDSDATVAASILPAVSFLCFGILLAACAVSGKNDSVFVVSAADTAAYKKYGASRFVRVAVSVVMGLSVLACSALVGLGWSHTATVSVKSSGLPLIASQDLEENRGARVFGLFADSASHVEYSVMRTPAGDLIDTNATTQIAAMISAEPQEDELKNIAAQLLSSNSDAAIGKLAKMGFTGIYIPASGSTVRANLSAHVTASSGTEQVVNNDSGLYVRLASVNETGARQRIDTTGETASYSDPLRIVWLVLVGLIVVAYLIVAIPRSRSLAQEEE
jgi:GT2 family glycosyltransferase